MMVLSTSTLRDLYAPACGRKGKLYIPAYRALDTVFHRHNYRPRAGVTGAYNCRKITGGSGYSLHAYGVGDIFVFWTGVRCATSLAVDVNWDTNPYGPRLVTDMTREMIDDVLAIRTNSGAQVWGWGGYYRGNKDAMHFEIVCAPSDLATGIDPTTVRNGEQEEDDDMALSEEDKQEIVDRVIVGLVGTKENPPIWIDWRLIGLANTINERIEARTVPPVTVREDIRLNREIAEAVGVDVGDTDPVDP